MPSTRNVVQVFVSSPSDVSKERESLEAVVNELNRVWSSRLGLAFELLRWETSVHPAFSTDPQSVINTQIGDGYDVFLGILWGRFGTPTPRAESGTEEEFVRALERRRRTGAPEIMIYFKDAPIPPSRIDPAQLANVQKFKESLGSFGGMYSMFEDASSFEASLRSHLSALAQQFSSTLSEPRGLPTARGELRLENDSESDETEDFGYFDYLEMYSVRIAEMTASLEAINEATVRIGELMSKRAAEVNALEKPVSDLAAARRIMKRSAGDLTSFAATYSNQIAIFAASREAAFQALSNALALRADFTDGDEEDLRPLEESVRFMTETIARSKTSLSGFRSSTNGLPRLTSELNRAKRSAVAQLDAMMDELTRTESTLANIIEAITKMARR